MDVPTGIAVAVGVSVDGGLAEGVGVGVSVEVGRGVGVGVAVAEGVAVPLPLRRKRDGKSDQETKGLRRCWRPYQKGRIDARRIRGRRMGGRSAVIRKGSQDEH